MNNIIENLSEVINTSANILKSDTKTAQDKLIAVSKTKSPEEMMQAYNFGIRDFGENYVQELTEKIELLPKDIRWHMIGHLQSNKVKYIVGKVFLIHSVDSFKLAKEISKESVKKNITSNILIEINVAGEDSKFGTSDMNANLELIKEISTLDNINIRGLMTIAPYTNAPESNRKYFKTLYSFANGEALKYIKGTPVLSMGMSGDYEIALEEGASYIRVGSKIFGERIYAV